MKVRQISIHFSLNPDGVSHCEVVLKVLRLATQAALHKEELCWLVFNSIKSRHYYIIRLFSLQWALSLIFGSFLYLSIIFNSDVLFSL